MTLTIPDVEKWDPGKLTASATAINKLYGDLDNAVKNGTTKIESLQWDGTAAAAAKTRMELEKTRASAVSQALMNLGTAFNKRVGDLSGAKDQVIKLRNIATTPPPGGLPAFSVNPNGTISPEARIQWIRDHQKGPDGKDLVDSKYLDPMIIKIRAEAAEQERNLLAALKHAEEVAATAGQEIITAKTQVDTAYNGLGDPKLGVTASAPADTSPAAVNSNSSTPHYQSTSNTSHSNGTSSHNGSSHYSNASMSDRNESNLSQPSGNVAEWIAQAREILIQEGVPADQIDDKAIATIIEHESGGNPSIVNDWDSNAAAGHPSKGLMQTIDSTFNSYAVPGHTDILNPVDNIVAASRYAIHRYGSLSDVPGVVAVRHGGAYVGY